MSTGWRHRVALVALALLVGGGALAPAISHAQREPRAPREVREVREIRCGLAKTEGTWRITEVEVVEVMRR